MEMMKKMSEKFEKLRYIGFDNDLYKFEDKDNNIGTYKIYYTKDFIKNLEVGKMYNCLVNGEWINKAVALDVDNNEIEESKNSFNKSEYYENKQNAILTQHYSSDAVELLKELYRKKDISEITETELIEDHERITNKLIAMHKRLMK